MRPRTWILFTQVSVLTVLVILALFCRAADLRPESLTYPCCLVYALVVGWNVWSWKRQVGRVIDPYLLFLVAAVLFNGGQAVLEIFALNNNGILNSRFSPETTLDSLFLITLGLTALQLGALMSLAVVPRCIPDGTDRMVGPRRWQALRLLGWGAISISLVPCLAVLGNALRSVMTYGYFVGLFQQDASTGIEAAPNILATLLVPGALLLLASSQRRPLPAAVSGTIVFLYAAVNFFMGSRAPAVASLTAFLWLWHRCIRPLRKATVAAVVLVMFLLLPTIAAIRNVSGEYRSSLPPIMETFTQLDNPVVSLLGEMGYSMSTVAYTMDLVPTVRTFDLGRSYGYALLTVFPNLFWDIHPTMAHGFLANWLVWTVDPRTAAVNGGLGFSFIAEAYLNFGWFGTPLVMVLIGFLLARMSAWTHHSQDPMKFAVVASILYFVLIFARGESASVVRGVVWFSLLPYFAVRLMSKYRFCNRPGPPVPRKSIL